MDFVGDLEFPVLHVLERERGGDSLSLTLMLLFINNISEVEMCSYEHLIELSLDASGSMAVDAFDRLTCAIGQRVGADTNDGVHFVLMIEGF